MEEPWEALDVDDSDLSSFRPPPKRRQTLIDPPIPSSVLRPCSHRSSQPPSQHPGPQTLVSQAPRSPGSFSLPPPESRPRSEEAKGERRIPGPAGAVQAAMQRRARRSSEGFPIAGGEEEEEANVIPTQEYIKRALENGDEDDGDFTLDPWVCAVEFMRRRGLVDGDGVAIGTPLCSLKSGTVPDKVSQVVAIVKSCTPNGLGDMMVTLKDPTGTVGATIHRKVLREKGFTKEISVGAVLILQKVAVFSPSRCTCYLNITLNNIIKVISKDSGPPSKENFSPPAKERPSSLEIWEKSSTQEKASSQLRGRIEGILSSLKQSTNTKERTGGCPQYEQSGGVQRTDSGSNQTGRNHDISMVNEPSPAAHDEISQFRAARSGETMDCSTSENIKCYDTRSGIAEVSDNKGGVSADRMRKQKQQQLSSRASLLQWTDEQLEELMDCE
ncbi:hypothetical protein BT93_F0175 [Corymbia citriodora subsp. variegata]|nr:hypothetical protein BT93_F0175 [Corymbia citriodora subsp. variegata]